MKRSRRVLHLPQPAGHGFRIKSDARSYSERRNTSSGRLLEDRDSGNREHPREFIRVDSVTDTFDLIWGIPLPFAGEFEVVIMIAVVIEEMDGSD